MIRLAESQSVFFDGRIFEIGELAGQLKLHIGAIHFVRAKLRAEILDLRRQIRLQLFAILLRQEIELRVHFSAHGQAADENLPVGEVQLIDGQLQRRFLEPGLALAPAQIHWLVQRGAEQVVLVLFDGNVQLLQERRLVVEVDCDLVIEIQIQRRRGLFALPNAELASR